MSIRRFVDKSVKITYVHWVYQCKVGRRWAFFWQSIELVMTANRRCEWVFESNAIKISNIRSKSTLLYLFCGLDMACGVIRGLFWRTRIISINWKREIVIFEIFFLWKFIDMLSVLIVQRYLMNTFLMYLLLIFCFGIVLGSLTSLQTFTWLIR